MVNSGRDAGGTNRIGRAAVQSGHEALHSFPNPLERSPERVTKVDVTGQGVDGLAVHENLHAGHGGANSRSTR